jgi:YidC/Oxa1 family membrane protein insertase
MHDVTAMPIWLSIVATTMLLRIGLLPAMVYTMRNNAKLQGLQPQMDAIKVRTQAAQASGLSMETARAEETAQLQALFKRHDCNPFRGLLMPVVQAPFMISLFFALKSLEDPAVWPMAQLGGLAWFTDLTAPDELMVLPALSAAGFLATFEVASRGGSDMVRSLAPPLDIA